MAFVGTLDAHSRHAEDRSRLLINASVAQNTVDDVMFHQGYKLALEGQFYGKLTGLIGYLRLRANRITTKQSTCPKLAKVQRITMSSSTHWLAQNRYRVQAQLDEKKPACAPGKIWWTFLHAVH